MCDRESDETDYVSGSSEFDIDSNESDNTDYDMSDFDPEFEGKNPELFVNMTIVIAAMMMGLMANATLKSNGHFAIDWVLCLSQELGPFSPKMCTCGH